MGQTRVAGKRGETTAYKSLKMNKNNGKAYGTYIGMKEGILVQECQPSNAEQGRVGFGQVGDSLGKDSSYSMAIEFSVALRKISRQLFGE